MTREELGLNPDELASLFKSETAKWAKVIKDNNGIKEKNFLALFAPLGIKQELSRNSSRCPMRQRQPLSLRESFQPVNERCLGCHFDVGWNHRSERHLHEVKGEEVFHHGDGNMARRSRATRSRSAPTRTALVP